MTNQTLSVPEIHCGHCKESIEGAVGEVPGVERATVDIDASTVEFDFDGADDRLDVGIEPAHATPGLHQRLR